MPNGDGNGGRRLPHIEITRWRESAQYVYPRMRRDQRDRREDHHEHAEVLLEQLTRALGNLPARDQDQRIAVDGLKRGTLVEVETMVPTARAKATKTPALDFPGHEIVVLRSERNEDRTETAVVFVPDDARVYLRNRISAYGSENLGNQPRPDVDKFEVIETIRDASGRSLLAAAPDDQNQRGWWELWLRRPDTQRPDLIANAVVEAVRGAGFDVHPERLTFPDTAIIFAHGSQIEIVGIVDRLNGAISEIRPAAGSIEPFLDLGENGLGQQALVEDYAARVDPPADGAPVVCVIDTGVAAAHPLVAPGLAGAWSVNDAWGTDDHAGGGGHGTGMAGLVLHGDLATPMADGRRVQLGHAAESVKFLPPAGFPPNEPARYGIITQSAVAVAEVERPNVPRSFCIATSSDHFDPDGPSSWSGALDQICSGAMPGERLDGVAAKNHPKRLVFVATGNITGGMKADVEQHHSLEDPSQSWNALSVGGYTAKIGPSADDPDLNPLVAANEKSPFSRGSKLLPVDLTPMKPEVLFEAGNMMVDAGGFCGWHPAVSLLTSGKDVAAQPLVPFWATSAATGVAGNFIGRLKAGLPERWPETYRALTVHSAEWPQPIRSKLVGRGRSWRTISKGEKQQIMREVGYGVPDLGRALASASNDVTLLVESEIQPYALGADGRGAVFNEVHFFALPWPRAALEALENAAVTMKVTLSYFIEPNLTGRAATRPDTYRSYGLRFAIKKRTETAADFRRRLSNAPGERTENDGEADYWLLGPQAMQAGSLHCDLWRGPAIDLAAHDQIAIFPVGGWWKSHVGQRRISDRARYTLAISISAPDQDVDLYAEIEAAIETRVAAEVVVDAASGER
ncbi:S8 family peptidase [Sphingomonas nostoxanthinifaciens]|uniref:S8 family peptidase n=1 Tax=Sphingomonas nostoxanthinifaciens TaxID=2872652 RepID=UPI001CC20BB4|nr:S8 family peptidase [Sphingomonas nostoxanthinifaciens]UAK23846.1 S8 family peptidase [Sphingomonas nostoxanthinifaciens]